MPYEVKAYPTPSSPPAVVIKQTLYLRMEIKDAISAEISLWRLNENVGSYFSLKYWESFFNWKQDNYSIVLKQIDSLSTNVFSYRLHYTTDLEEAKIAYNRICSTIAPLVHSCTLLLSKDLLKAVILQYPIKPSKLVKRISEEMAKQPNAHSDWVRVLHAVVFDAIQKDGDEAHDEVDCVLGGGETPFNAEATDDKGNTLLHLAQSGKHVSTIIKATKSEEEKKKLVNQRNKDGHTPLHSAFKENKHEVVPHLIEAGADIEATAENEENGLHVAAKSGSAECIRTAHHCREEFLKKDSENNIEKNHFLNAMNAQDKHGHTPLVHAVCANFIDSTVVFLQAGALLDLKNSKTGDTALHYAAEMGYFPIVKALLAFGAEMEIKNNNGETPLMLASSSQVDGARESEKVLTEMIQLKKEAEAKMTKTFEPIEIPPNALFLLSMDGGGTRGLLLTQTLIAIHRRIKQIKPDCLPLHKYFDYIAGTSAGGLATLSIACASWFGDDSIIVF